jgi:HEAT repeat protein
MIADRSVDEWFSSLPKTNGIYRIIEKTMDEKSQKERIWAVIALGESGDPRAVRPLIDCCRDRDPEIRGHAIGALHKLKSGRAVSVLIDRLKDKREQPEIRRHAAEALAEIRSSSAIEGLREMLSDADAEPALHSYIAGVLGQKGSQ